MPINKALEELLATLPEADRGPLKASLEKHPQLGEGFLRQSDYDRKMNDIKTERQKEADAVKANNDKVAKYQKWYDEESPKFDGLVTKLATAEAQVKTLTEQVAEAAAGRPAGEGEVNISEVRKEVEDRLSKFNAPTQEQINKIIGEEIGKATQAARDSFMTETFPATMGVVMDMADLQWEHRTEFNGEAFPRMEVGKYMKENNLSNARTAYDQFISGRRAEKKTADAVEKAKKDAIAEFTNNNIPGTSGSPILTEMGHIQAGLVNPANGVIPEGATTRSLAATAAQELRAEGKF